MNELVEFLAARLDEDEQAARDAGGDRWLIGNAVDPTKPCSIHIFPSVRAVAEQCGWLHAEHIVRHDPARGLAEVDAKRRLVHAHDRPHECLALTGSGEHSVVDGEPWELWEAAHTEDHGPCYMLRCLALPYAEHDDYRDEWRQ